MADIEKGNPPGGTGGPGNANAIRDEGNLDVSFTPAKQESLSASSDWELLKRAPTLMAYIERVGATQKSFRRYVIESDAGHGYRNERGTINVEPDGLVTCHGDVEELTEAEAKAIEKEVPAAGWPTSTGAPKGSLPDALKGKDPAMIFLFKTRDGKKTLFVQERVEPEDSPKYYVPWSYWSDEKWRQMEPDGLLPLYGLERLGDNDTVFLHEGPKAAHHCAWMIGQETKSARDAFNKHPWCKELGHAAHLGWAGGAPSPHRTDWELLRRSGIKQIYMVADNDHPGQEAVKKISKETLLLMTAIMFDDRFKEGFDLGDPWPDANSDPKQPDWWKGDRYLGPSFHDLCVPATWATREVIEVDESGKPKKGRHKFVLRDEFVKQWLMSSEPHLFTHRKYAHMLLKPEVFNKKVAPFSDVDDVGRLLAKHLVVHADGIMYRPRPADDVARIINVDGQRLINTYRPPAIKPVPGNVDPFLEYLDYLIPDPEDRFKVMRWCATLIARPQIRMRYSMLLISETQGVGKTTLSDAILKPLVGPWNVSSPNEHQIVDSGFNGWIAHKRLACVNEIYSGERRKAYDRLKQVTADDSVEVNKKHLEPYDVENYIHVVACSNSTQALWLDDTDRRFLVPGVTETLKNKDWWNAFYAYLNGGGLSAIAAWAEAFVQEHGPVETGDRAPDTTKKQEVIAGSRSDGSQLAYDLAQLACSPYAIKAHGNLVVRMDEVRAWVAEMRGMSVTDKRLESALTLRKAMVAGGMKRPARKDGADGRIAINKRPVEVLANYQIEAGAFWTSSKEAKDGLDVFHKKPSWFFEVPM